MEHAMDWQIGIPVNGAVLAKLKKAVLRERLAAKRYAAHCLNFDTPIEKRDKLAADLNRAGGEILRLAKTLFDYVEK